MKKYDVRLLSATYKIEDDSPVIELYGRSRDGKSIIIRAYNFKPYFHLISPTEEIIDELRRDDGVIKIEKIELLVDGEMKDTARITVKIPKTVPGYRDRLRKKGFAVMAADIPFAHRFIYDYDLGSCIRIKADEEDEEIRQRYTAEIVVKVMSKEDFEKCEPFKPDLKILSFDIENSIETGELFTICCAIRENKELRFEKISGKEKEIITKFIEIVIKEDPDVITGYNIENYDFPQVLERAKKQGIKSLSIGRDYSDAKISNERFWKVSGRIVADAWWNAKMHLRPKKETLNYLSELVLNEKKLDVDPKKIEEEWRSDREKVIEYCCKDAELALRILEGIAVIEKSMDLATVSKLPVDDVLNGRTSTLIDSILIREADRNSIAVPTTHHESKTRKIEGGYVHTIEPGLYHWVCVLDFKSMYPSVIISNNICFTTLSPDGEIVSPIGERFLSKDMRKGLLPKILESLMKDREEFKRRMKESKSKEEREYYNGLQDAIKTLMNSFYGVFASAFYRFTNPRIGASITGFARESIKNLISKLEERGLTVIYSDTDSVFFQSPYNSLDETLRFGKEISEAFSKDEIVLEFEKVLEPFFSHGKKKRYVGKVVWPEEGMLVRGYEIRRTDSFDLQSEALTKIFEEILNDNIDGAIKSAREIITDIREGKVPVEKLVISRTCKDFSFYKDPDSQVNVQAAKKLMALGYEFIPGMKVSYIVVNSKATPMEVEPYIDGREFTYEPDWNYYAERVAMSLARATEVFGWDERTLLDGKKQADLFSKEFQGKLVSEKREKGAGKKKLRKTDKELKLEDFL